MSDDGGHGKTASDKFDELLDQALANPPAPGSARKGSVRAFIAEKLEGLLEARRAGYNDRQLAEMLTKAGVEIKAGTLKVYLNRAARERAGNAEGKASKTKPAKRKATPSVTSPATQPETKTETPSKTSSETKPQGVVNDDNKAVGAVPKTLAATPSGTPEGNAAAAPAATAREKTKATFGHNPNADV